MIVDWLRLATGHTSPELSLVYVKNLRAYATDRMRLHSLGDWYQPDGYYCPYTGAAVSLALPYPDVEGLLRQERAGYTVETLELRREDFRDTGKGYLRLDATGRPYPTAHIDDIFSVSDGIASVWYYKEWRDGALHITFNNGLAHAAVMPATE